MCYTTGALRVVFSFRNRRLSTRRSTTFSRRSSANGRKWLRHSSKRTIAVHEVTESTVGTSRVAAKRAPRWPTTDAQQLDRETVRAVFNKRIWKTSRTCHALYLTGPEPRGLFILFPREERDFSTTWKRRRTKKTTQGRT